MKVPQPVSNHVFNFNLVDCMLKVLSALFPQLRNALNVREELPIFWQLPIYRQLSRANFWL